MRDTERFSMRHSLVKIFARFLMDALELLNYSEATQLIVHICVKNCPAARPFISLVGCWKSGLLPLLKLLKIFRMKSHSGQLHSAIGTSKKPLGDCLGICICLEHGNRYRLAKWNPHQPGLCQHGVQCEHEHVSYFQVSFCTYKAS